MTSTMESKSSDLLYHLDDGAEIYCRVRGNGDELIVFLHAVGGDNNSWEPQLRHFGSKYTCLTFDFRGHGKSRLSNSASCHSQATIEVFARDTAHLISELGFSKAHLVGLSMGGVVAQKVLELFPNRIQSLTLANTWCYMPDGPERIKFIENQLSTKSMAESARELIPGLFSPGTASDIVETIIRSEAGKDKEVFLASWRSMFQVDFRETIGSIRVPVLLIAGGADNITPTSLLDEISRRVPLAQLKEFPGCGHFSNLERADDFNNALSVNLRRARLGNLSFSQKTRLTGADPQNIELETDTVAHGLMRLLPMRGIECFFSNSGTDFTPIIDALARYHDDDDFDLKTFVAPHENTAIAMAHGHFLLSKKPQAVMAHVNVGTANMGLGIINASRSRIPMLVMAGKTPWYDSEIDGCRTNFVQWGQDTFDQSAYFREFTKWDYELKGPHHLETVVDRALAIAQSDPQGPVYLTLPKEPLCAPLENLTVGASPAQVSSTAGGAAPSDIEAACRLLARARKPLVITSEVGRYPGGVAALLSFCERFAIPVIEHGKRNFFNFPTTHDLHLGFSPSPYVEEADVILVVECHVPWIPALSSMDSRAMPPQIVQIGIDPLCSKLPMRRFPVHHALAGQPALTLKAFEETLLRFTSSDANSTSSDANSTSTDCDLMATLSARRQETAKEHDRVFQSALESAKAHESRTLITKTYLSYAIGQAIDDDVVIFNEYNLEPSLVPRHLCDSWFENSIASGLGWSLGAALGAQIASPSQTMLVTLGDGTYLFNTPLSAHYVAAAYALPIVIVVFNDSAWSTIKKSYKGTTPDGWALRKGNMPLCDFDLTISFEQIAQSCGGIGMRIESPGDLIPAIKQAIATSRTERRHVLLNVICERDG